jgi:hypothetical protein
VIFTEDLNKTYKGEALDMSGKVVLVIELQEGSNEINFEKYAYGVYLLKITMDDHVVFETKILKY